ncbi:hypothetical protein BC351_12585 [Paenibacillus ferrarius]|uniref:Intracellular proteinase inhibitor BsuPI domain-containing protein n=1 Tax=Paenibacillus ferrarius TaxID=1469647 RepID=A0A1V4H6M0_9BACL|nr:hypothetical protein [Paenibacillus ferrarius]OPH46772.1 hypothetical protein BC351_12585 [Paenibacillus ferrarius]
MKHLLWILALFFGLSILGCASQPVHIKETNSEGAHSTNMEYTVGLTSPSIANKNTNFTIEAKFTNNKDSDIRITHGEKLFTFYISNSKGKIINHYPSTSLGVVRSIPTNGTIDEGYTFNIDIAGEYEVWAVANFDTSENNTDKKHELPTQKQTLVVR